MFDGKENFEIMVLNENSFYFCLVCLKKSFLKALQMRIRRNDETEIELNRDERMQHNLFSFFLSSTLELEHKVCSNGRTECLNPL